MNINSITSGYFSIASGFIRAFALLKLTNVILAMTDSTTNFMSLMSLKMCVKRRKEIMKK